MILFPEDVRAINELLEGRAGLDPELVDACWEHIEHGQYPDAVFKGFRVLEGRLQQRSGIEGETAGKMLNAALTTGGPLTGKLGLTGQQAANYRDLLKGAFAFFRNPEAHPQEAVIDYGSAECQAVLGFVNLVLGVAGPQARGSLADYAEADQPRDWARRRQQVDHLRGASHKVGREGEGTEQQLLVPSLGLASHQ